MAEKKRKIFSGAEKTKVALAAVNGSRPCLLGSIADTATSKAVALQRSCLTVGIAHSTEKTTFLITHVLDK